MSLISLPVEVQVLILSQLSFRDIMRCRSLCRHFYDLVNTSKVLCFTIELGAAGMKDNPNCQELMSGKIEKLWKSNIAWANLHWLCRRSISLSGKTGQLFDFSGGLFFFTSPEGHTNTGNPTTIEWLTLPSRREPDVRHQPEKVTFDMLLFEFAVDATQDLIIGVELTSFRTNKFYTIMCNLHARSISTNKIHPFVARHVLSTRFASPITDFQVDAQICGNHVGILLSRRFGGRIRDSFDLFLLFDWTTGFSKANMGTYHMEEFWETFCFLTPDSVLIPSAVNSLLNVYSFNNKPDSLKHEISLLLPEPLTRRSLRHVFVSSQPPTLSSYFTHPTADNPPFIADMDEGILILQLDYRYHSHGIPGGVDDGLTSQQIVAIPRRVLTQFANLARGRTVWFESMIEDFHGRTNRMEPCHSMDSLIPVKPVPSHYCDHEQLYANASAHPQNKRFPHVHSEQWIHYTRWGIDSVSPDMGRYAYGSRYLGMSSRASLPNAPASSIALYDFNVRNDLRGLGHMLEEENVRPYPAADEEFNEDEDWDYDEATGDRKWPVYPSRIVATANVVNIPEVFKASFSTALPYRVTETEMMLPWDAAMIDGERIVGLEFYRFLFRLRPPGLAVTICSPVL
ncbi:uncharacterized protein FOMMEDRAFT_157961 [Fomitiporia mediterranea MF3/22]|uniref:uncharacterized protein n=1 Tax=Fomitiporia mediterranea (strain MF3/22) TaxID=694068 RepID=UPI000440844E|nr:uncharacterized protein FOMMEDRAFT_157961 [Fomitiporia mediterranea MF3/22]EJD00852.1 hypothetical protein FOMMEDRAFT_157961 [Fomitiporia mediterranea MF3/22]